ncbi:MAG: renalase [Verrucomicrobiales bacterium]|jgi:renalase
MSEPRANGGQLPRFDCTIIGAGISGLLAANVMAEAGLKVCVLDKGRGVGGRMATRRRDGAIFDHGAQFFTVRNERFSRWVEEWRKLGLVKPWYDYGTAGMHFRGAPGMTAVAKHLADRVDVRRETLVSKVSQCREDAQSWTVETRTGQHFQCRQILLTAPVPQSLALLVAGGVELPSDDVAALEAIRFHRCIAALAILEEPSALTKYGGALKLSGEPVQWIGDNYHKGISTDVPAVTIHSTPAFAEEYWNVEDSVRLPKLLDAAAPYLHSKVASVHGHRWGFSALIGRLQVQGQAYVDAERGLAIAGDGLAGGRIEGAALSGLAAASKLVASTISV